MVPHYLNKNVNANLGSLREREREKSCYLKVITKYYFPSLFVKK